MPLNAHLLLAAAILCCFVTMTAAAMDTFTRGHDCRCLRATNSFINPRTFKRVEILPPGAHCRKTEIIITKTDGTKVCVAPEAQWLRSVLNRLAKQKKYKESQSQPSLVTAQA